jgi:hypothetical protein
MEDVKQPAPAEEFKGKGIEAYKRMFSRAEEACTEARKLAHRDRDWHDNFDDSQWSEAEKKILHDRRQPIVTSNRIKRKVGFICGLEQKQRTDPRAMPRNPQDTDTADIVTPVLEFIEQETRFDHVASQAFRDLNIEGIQAVEVIVEGGDKVVINHLMYDGFFYDPRSKKRDFSDARYLGYQDWFDADDAFDMFRQRADKPEEQERLDGELKSKLESSYEDGAQDEGYEDKPWNMWGDEDRNRVRIACMYWKGEGGVWNYTYFTGGGVLKEGVSPYLDDEGKPDCAIIAASAYMTRKNERYGPVRDMISPQSEMNFRRSAALFLIKQRRTWARAKGILPTNASETLASADGQLIANGVFGQDWGFIESAQEVAQNFELLQEAKGEIDVQGPNAGLQGRGTENQSGIAIERQQQAGLAEENDLFDTHNDWKLRIYRAMWYRAKQFWREPKFIRITDDQNAFKFLHLNQQQPVIDPMTGQPQIGPDGQPVVQMVPGTELAKMDADITLHAAPESLSLQHEQFIQLADMAKAGVPIPPDVLLEASQIRDKQKLVARLKEEGGKDAQLQQAAQQMEQMQKVIEEMQAKLQDASQSDEGMKAMAEAEKSKDELRKRELDNQQYAMDFNLKSQANDLKARELDIKELELAAAQRETMRVAQEEGKVRAADSMRLDQAFAGLAQTLQQIAATQQQTAALLVEQGDMESEAEIVRDPVTNRMITARVVKKKRGADEWQSNSQ